MSFKYKIGDLVYAYDTYRGVIGLVTKQLESTKSHPWNFYSIHILKKTQPSFNVKRWDDEAFSEHELNYIKFWNKDDLILLNEKIIPIMSDEDIIKHQSENYPFLTKLINNFNYYSYPEEPK